MIFLIPIAIAILFGGLIWLSYRSNQKRTRAFAAWAAAHGWSYTPRDDSYANLEFGRPFGEGHSRHALDVLTKVDGGRESLCFTLRYETTSSNGSTGNSDTTHYYAVYARRLAKMLPTLRVERENVLGRLARAVGFHDIEFESEDFNKAFAVHSDNRKFASDVINPPMMQYLLGNEAPGFSIVAGYAVSIARGRMKAELVESGMLYLDTIISYVPDFIWNA